MNQYIAQFLIYTLAMTGFIILALYIYKKTSSSGISKSDKNNLSVENILRLSPSKMLYVIKAGNDRFLIAGDPQNTSLIAKLEPGVNYSPYVKSGCEPERIKEYTEV